MKCYYLRGKANMVIFAQLNTFTKDCWIVPLKLVNFMVCNYTLIKLLENNQDPFLSRIQVY